MRYKDAKKELNKNYNSLSPEERFLLCKTVVENYELNRSIWKEMHHYENTKSILGEHPIFTDRKLVKKVEQMNGVELSNRRTSLQNSIWRDSKKLGKHLSSEDREKVINRLEKKNQELKLIDKALNAI